MARTVACEKADYDADLQFREDVPFSQAKLGAQHGLSLAEDQSLFPTKQLALLRLPDWMSTFLLSLSEALEAMDALQLPSEVETGGTHPCGLDPFFWSSLARGNMQCCHPSANHSNALLGFFFLPCQICRSLFMRVVWWKGRLGKGCCWLVSVVVCGSGMLPDSLRIRTWVSCHHGRWEDSW